MMSTDRVAVMREQHRRRNHQLRAAGLCPQCRAPWTGPQWRCDTCRQQQVDEKRRLRAR